MIPILHSLGVLTLVVVSVPAESQRAPESPPYAITTRQPRAQRSFDRGLRHTWDFNHTEARRAFEEGERADPTCAMCAWGVALALGPTPETGMDSVAGVQAYAAIQRAARHARTATVRERALIDALAVRYAPVPPRRRAPLDSAWARAVGAVADRFPEDLPAQLLHADALMILAMGRYWDDARAPRPGTPTILARLRAALALEPDHRGAAVRLARVLDGGPS